MVAIDKKNIAISIIVVIACIALWYIFSSGHNGSGADETRDSIQSTRTEQQAAGREITESKHIVTEVRTTNTAIKREIDESRTINKSSAELIAEGKRILQQIRERN